MKPLLIGIFVLLLAACSEKELRQTYEIVTANVDEVPLSQREVAAALKDSLSQGATRGAIIASLKNGYYENPSYSGQLVTPKSEAEDKFSRRYAQG